jgi:hypothetical protein
MRCTYKRRLTSISLLTSLFAKTTLSDLSTLKSTPQISEPVEMDFTMSQKNSATIPSALSADKTVKHFTLVGLIAINIPFIKTVSLTTMSNVSIISRILSLLKSVIMESSIP